jgi:hypothetical protein
MESPLRTQENFNGGIKRAGNEKEEGDMIYTSW